MITKASLISIENLELAWRRITTAKNLQHNKDVSAFIQRI